MNKFTKWIIIEPWEFIDEPYQYCLVQGEHKGDLILDHSSGKLWPYYGDDNYYPSEIAPIK